VEIPDFGSGPLDVVARTALVYVFLVVVLRLAGKREVGQLSLFDLIVLLLVADAVQNAMVGENATLAGGLIAAATLVVLDRLLDVITDRSARARKALEGEPRMLIRDGVILDKAMHEETVSHEELASALRANGLTEASDAAFAILETNGTISVIPKTPGASPKPPDGID
jgi:uncharacterized membrane protein YcaP (DUF421 family)